MALVIPLLVRARELHPSALTPLPALLPSPASRPTPPHPPLCVLLPQGASMAPAAQAAQVGPSLLDLAPIVHSVKAAAAAAARVAGLAGARGVGVHRADGRFQVREAAMRWSAPSKMMYPNGILLVLLFLCVPKSYK